MQGLQTFMRLCPLFSLRLACQPAQVNSFAMKIQIQIH